MPCRARTAAERTRRWRERRQTGTCFAAADVPADLVALMVAEGWLGAAEARDPKVLAEALIDLADCYFRGTLDIPRRRAV